MAGPLQKDRVKQTSTTTGTGTFDLDATIPNGARGFVAAIGNGNTVHYVIEHQTANEWEVGIGTVTDASPDTLSRTTILASSNSGSAVNFSSGTKNVFCAAPADYGIPYIRVHSTNAFRVADETIGSQTLGNARGNWAVDLQGVRNNAAKVASGAYTFLGGGLHNTVSGSAAVCVGGNGNTSSANQSFVGAGNNNTCSGNRSVCCGGLSNVSGIHRYSFVGGGYDNQATSPYTTCVGGAQNRATSDNAAVLGGNFCRATAGASTVCGGQRNYASAVYSAVLGGRRSVADKYGQQAHASGMFSSSGDAQRSNFIARIATTNATQTEMFLDGSSNRLVLANNTTWTFDILITARRTDVDNEGAGYSFQGVIDRNGNAASTAIVGTVTKTVIAEDTAAWDVDVDADTTNGSLRIRVTGEASKNINWVAHIRTVETTG